MIVSRIAFIFIFLFASCAQNGPSSSANRLKVLEAIPTAPVPREFSSVFGVRSLTVSSDLESKNKINRGTVLVCSNGDCQKMESLYAAYGYGPSVLYSVAAVPLESATSGTGCPDEDELLSWMLVGSISNQNICVSTFKNKPAVGSGMQYLRDIYLGGNDGSRCRYGYIPVTRISNCVDGECSSQLMCLSYGYF